MDPRSRGENGYGVISKVLHWLTVLAIAAQLAIGYNMDVDAAADRADDRVDAFEDRGESPTESQSEAAEERFEAEVERREEAAENLEQSPGSPELTDVVTGAAFNDGLSGVEAHVLIGITVLALGLARLVWRRAVPLPPSAEHLSTAERTLEAWLEKVLLALLLAVPGSGLLLVRRWPRAAARSCRRPDCTARHDGAACRVGVQAHRPAAQRSPVPDAVAGAGSTDLDLVATGMLR